MNSVKTRVFIAHSMQVHTNDTVIKMPLKLVECFMHRSTMLEHTKFL